MSVGSAGLWCWSPGVCWTSARSRRVNDTGGVRRPSGGEYRSSLDSPVSTVGAYSGGPAAYRRRRSSLRDRRGGCPSARGSSSAARPQHHRMLEHRSKFHLFGVSRVEDSRVSLPIELVTLAAHY